MEVLHLVPELCLVCPVPCALWRALAMLPRLMWHTETALQAAVLRCNLAPSGLPLEKWVLLGMTRTQTPWTDIFGMHTRICLHAPYSPPNMLSCC